MLQYIFYVHLRHTWIKKVYLLHYLGRQSVHNTSVISPYNKYWFLFHQFNTLPHHNIILMKPCSEHVGTL